MINKLSSILADSKALFTEVAVSAARLYDTRIATSSAEVEPKPAVVVDTLKPLEEEELEEEEEEEEEEEAAAAVIGS